MVEIYSHSKLWLFESCPEYYKKKYIDKDLPDIPKSSSLLLGSSVHETLEMLYRSKLDNKILTIDEVIQFYQKFWEENSKEKVWFREGETEKDVFNKGVIFLLNYYKTHYPFDEKVIDLEKKIIFPLDEKGEYFIQGYIDRLVLNNGVYEVHDYKTNAYLKSQDEIDKDRQLAFYHLGLQELYGKDIKVRLIWHFLAHNKKIHSKRTQSELLDLKKKTFQLIKKIESTKNWPACGNPWCDWCRYKSHQT